MNLQNYNNSVKRTTMNRSAASERFDVTSSISVRRPEKRVSYQDSYQHLRFNQHKSFQFKYRRMRPKIIDYFSSSSGSEEDDVQGWNKWRPRVLNPQLPKDDHVVHYGGNVGMNTENVPDNVRSPLVCEPQRKGLLPDGEQNYANEIVNVSSSMSSSVSNKSQNQQPFIASSESNQQSDLQNDTRLSVTTLRAECMKNASGVMAKDALVQGLELWTRTREDCDTMAKSFQIRKRRKKLKTRESLRVHEDLRRYAYLVLRLQMQVLTLPNEMVAEGKRLETISKLSNALTSSANAIDTTVAVRELTIVLKEVIHSFAAGLSPTLQKNLCLIDCMESPVVASSTTLTQSSLNGCLKSAPQVPSFIIYLIEEQQRISMERGRSLSLTMSSTLRHVVDEIKQADPYHYLRVISHQVRVFGSCVFHCHGEETLHWRDGIMSTIHEYIQSLEKNTTIQHTTGTPLFSLYPKRRKSLIQNLHRLAKRLHCLIAQTYCMYRKETNVNGRSPCCEIDALRSSLNKDSARVTSYKSRLKLIDNPHDTLVHDTWQCVPELLVILDLQSYESCQSPKYEWVLQSKHDQDRGTETDRFICDEVRAISHLWKQFSGISDWDLLTRWEKSIKEHINNLLKLHTRHVVQQWIQRWNQDKCYVRLTRLNYCEIMMSEEHGMNDVDDLLGRLEEGKKMMKRVETRVSQCSHIHRITRRSQKESDVCTTMEINDLLEIVSMTAKDATYFCARRPRSRLKRQRELIALGQQSLQILGNAMIVMQRKSSSSLSCQ